MEARSRTPASLKNRHFLTVAQAAFVSNRIARGNIPASGNIQIPCASHVALAQCKGVCKRTIIQVSMYESIPDKFRLKLIGGMPFLPEGLEPDKALVESLLEHLDTDPPSFDVTSSKKSMFTHLVKVSESMWDIIDTKDRVKAVLPSVLQLYGKAHHQAKAPPSTPIDIPFHQVVSVPVTSQADHNSLKETVLAGFSASQQQLVQLGQQTEEKLGRLTEKQQQTQEQLGRFGRGLGRLTEQQQQTEEQLGRLTEQQQQTEEQLGRLTEQQQQTQTHLDQFSRQTQGEQEQTRQQLRQLTNQQENLSKSVIKLQKQLSQQSFGGGGDNFMDRVTMAVSTPAGSPPRRQRPIVETVHSPSEQSTKVPFEDAVHLFPNAYWVKNP